MRKTANGLMICTILCCCMAAPAWAGTFFSDLGTGSNVYNCCLAFSVFGSPNQGQSLEPASLFTSGMTGNVNEIQFALGYANGLSDSVTAMLMTDSGGVPGAVLGSWQVSSTELFGFCCNLVDITGITGIHLIAGQQYFLVLNPAVQTDDAWNLNSTGATGVTLDSSDGGKTWFPGFTNTLGALAVYGTSTPVPEPASLLLVASAGVLAWRKLRAQ
jgi:hypothetical protein